MPIREADPWRIQYFAHDPCPDDVEIPTEDADAWAWNPEHRWVYDKLRVGQSQGIEAAPHGVMPPSFSVFSKPVVNLRGMGVGSRVIASAEDYAGAWTAGHFWMRLLEGEHVSSDVAVERGRAAWWRHATGIPGPGGTFDRWIIHAAPRPALEASCGAWIARHLPGYTGMLNLETIGAGGEPDAGSGIIEVHLRFADQWPDLYGAGWVRALVALYATGRWAFPDTDRRDGHSVVLFGPPGGSWRHPPAALVGALRSMQGVSSVQVTFHEDRPAATHAMPPGGFRLAIVNCLDLDAGRAARQTLAEWFGVAAEGTNR
jgi:hypothetical protein